MESLYLATSLMMVDIPGPALDAATRAHLERYRFGGVCLFRKNIQNPAQVQKLVAEIREVLGPQAWIAIDQEGGAVQRVLELAQAPAPMALGAIGMPAPPKPWGLRWAARSSRWASTGTSPPRWT
jgi:beta-N-acetylhexosaminidase